MKKFTLLFLCLSVIGSSYAKSTLEKNVLSLKNSQEEFYQFPGKDAITPLNKKQAPQESATWQPGICTVYETYDMGESWEELDQYSYEYKYGLLYSSESSSEKQLYPSYDAHGNWTVEIVQTPEEDENGEIVWKNNQKEVRVFDEVDPTFQTVRAIYLWDTESESWAQAYKHEKVITRNAQGNVESLIVRSYADETTYVDLEGFRVIYDMDGVASTIITYEYDYENNAMVAGISYQDIVWVECGQILSLDYLCLKDLRASSYDIAIDGEILASAVITYNEPGEMFSCEKTTTDIDGAIEFYSYTQLDENGSYEEFIKAIMPEEVYGEKLIEQYNEYGRQTEMCYYFLEEDEWVIMDQLKFDLTYEDGKLMEEIVSITNPDTGELEPMEKYVYGEYEWVAIDKVESFNGKVYLNRTDQNLYLTSDEATSYAIYSVDGKMVQQGTAIHLIATDGLKKGIYIVKVNQDGVSKTLKFIK